MGDVSWVDTAGVLKGHPVVALPIRCVCMLGSDKMTQSKRPSRGPFMFALAILSKVVLKCCRSWFEVGPHMVLVPSTARTNPSCMGTLPLIMQGSLYLLQVLHLFSGTQGEQPS